MKTAIATIIVALTLCAACKKNHVVKPITVDGSWELRATKGGNILPTQYPLGNGRIVTFQSNTYTYYLSGSLVTQGSFLQHADNSGNDVITFSTGDFDKSSGMLQNDTLVVKPFNPEFSSSYYVKKQ